MTALSRYYIDNAVLGRCFLQQRIASAIVLMNDNSLNKICIQLKNRTF